MMMRVVVMMVIVGIMVMMRLVMKTTPTIYFYFYFYSFLIFYFFNTILVCLHSFLMYVCMYGCVGSSFLCEGFLQLWQAGATLHRSAWASHYRGLSLPSTGSRCAGSVIVAHGPSCSAACGIFPDQGSNPCPLHQQADSQPLHHQGSPTPTIFEC